MGPQCGDRKTLIEPGEFFSGFSRIDPKAALQRMEAFEKAFIEMLGRDMEALHVYLPRLKKKRQTWSPLMQGIAFRLVGRFYESQSLHYQAGYWSQKALALFEEMGDFDRQIQCLLVLMSSAVFRGKYTEAETWAAKILQRAPDHPLVQFKTHVNMGNACQRQHHYKEALKYFSEALGISEDLIPPTHLGVLFYNMGNTLVNLNSFIDAETYFSKASALFDKQRMVHYQAHVFQALAYLYTILGHYYQSENFINRALEAYQQCGDKVGAAYCLLEELQLKVQLRLSEKMLIKAEEALAVFGETGLKYEKGRLLYLLARYFLNSDAEMATDCLKQAKEVFSKEKNHLFLGKCWLLEGRILNQIGKKGQALFEKAYDVFRRLKAPDMELRCIASMFWSGDRTLSSGDIRRIRRLIAQGVDHETRVQVLYILAHHFNGIGQKKKAIMTVFEAVSLIEETRATIQTRDERMAFFHDYRDTYEIVVKWLCEWDNPEAARWAFFLMELTRNRLFYEQLAKKEHLKTDDPSVMKLQRLFNRENQLKRRLSLLDPGDFQFAEQEKTIKEALEDVRRDMERKRANLRNQERLGQYFPFRLEPEDFQKCLKKDQMIVSYFKTPNRLFRFQLTHDKLRLFSHIIPEGFSKQLNQFLRMMRAGLTLKAEQIKTLNQSISPILSPVIPRGIRHLFVVPHKELQGIPFSMLEKRGKPLIHWATLSVCPNLPTLLFSLQKEPSPLKNPVFFFSDDSDDPRANERKTLVDLFPKAAFSSKIRETEIERQFSDADFIHFAGHCFVDPLEPENSYLQLSENRIYLKALSQYKLNRPFINLATCGSGFHILGQGNEPRGFVSTFLAQGATTILSTLWEIEDSTAALWMDCFYKNLGEGLSQAHRLACESLANQGYHPFHWAGFQLTGIVS